jgi:hypothetical protein
MGGWHTPCVGRHPKRTPQQNKQILRASSRNWFSQGEWKLWEKFHRTDCTDSCLNAVSSESSKITNIDTTTKSPRNDTKLPSSPEKLDNDNTKLTEKDIEINKLTEKLDNDVKLTEKLDNDNTKLTEKLNNDRINQRNSNFWKLS